MSRSRTKWLKMSALALVVANIVAMPNALPALTGASKKAPTTTTIQDRDTLPFSGTARIPVLLFEPDGPITIHFLPSLRELLYPEEELVITPANCKVLSQTDTSLEIMPTYEDGSNQGYIYFHARNRSSREMRFLGSIHFASSKLPVDSDDDLWIDPKSIRDLAIMADENDRPFASIGFPSVGNLGWILFKHSDFEGTAPDRERRSRLPKWAEAELKFPPGTRRSAIPRSALPKRPSNCSGFVNGRLEVEGDWVTVGPPRLKGRIKVGSISSGGSSTHSFTVCGKAASKFLADLGIRMPLPVGRPINIRGNMTITVEINGCITVTVVNNTGRDQAIMASYYEVDQLMIKDVFCCVNGQVRLCERWVCTRTTTMVVTDIPGMGIVEPPLFHPVPPYCIRTD